MSLTIQPVQKRIVALDVLRGFALFGVLLVNMLDFSSSALRMDTIGTRGSELDQVIDIGIVFLAVTKFYLLFSFLFGVGFAVQMQRMEATGRAFVRLYLRRLAVLMIIGLAHSILLWDGDILRLYAIAGVGLLLVRRLSNRVLLAAAALITLAGLVIFSQASSLNTISSSMELDAIRLYTSGTYADLVQYRAGHQFVLDIQIPMVLVMFLLGLVVGRSGLLDDPARYQPVLRRWWLPALVMGLVGNAMLLIGYSEQNLPMVSFGIHIGAPALSAAYACFVLLNVERLSRLAPIGQMALSNYLTHSVICTTLFYGYGFGLYDRLSPTLTLLLVLLIFGSQIIISQAWMRAFRFGPMEWIWRCLTYGQIQAWRR